MSHTTARALLRPLSLDDLDALVEMESDADVVRYTPMAIAQTREQTAARLASQAAMTHESPFGIWLARTRTTNEAIGWFMLVALEGIAYADGRKDGPVPELGFMLRRACWGQGFATEIAQSIMEHSALPTIYATADARNTASLRVLDKLAFEPLCSVASSRDPSATLSRYSWRRQSS